MRSFFICTTATALLILAAAGRAQRLPSETNPNHTLVQSTLIAPGSIPFHLKAVITEGQEQSSYGDVEIFWSAPDKFRRLIHSDNLSQTLIVNGSNRFEKNSSDYFPLQLRTLVTAMVDPQPIIEAIRPGDGVLTKANGAVNESGIKCIGRNHNLCVTDENGLRETIAASGHSVDFSQYENFHGKRVARILTNAPRLGENLMTLQVTELEQMNSPDPTLFEITRATEAEQQLRFTTVPEEELRKDLLTPQAVIIWPQTLDSAETGPANFYVSIDRSGAVREVEQLYTVNERTNDSAIRQITKWKFKPITKDGLPAQAEGVLSFTLNTRAWGPPSPLTDAEARKLASNITEPGIPSGTYPAGTVYTFRIAVDAEGQLIEAIASGGPSGLLGPCLDALRKWRFSPIMENGQPRPYRGTIVFRIP